MVSLQSGPDQILVQTNSAFIVFAESHWDTAIVAVAITLMSYHIDLKTPLELPEPTLLAYLRSGYIICNTNFVAVCIAHVNNDVIQQNKLRGHGMK